MKKTKKVFSVILAVIVLLVAANLIFRFYYQFQFNRRVEALAAQGYPVSLADLEKDYVLPEGAANAADIYLEAFSYYQEPNEFEKQFLPIRGDYRWTDDVPPFPQEVINAIESSLKANQKTLELLDQAADMEHCLWPRKLEKLKDIYFPQEYLKGIKVSGMNGGSLSKLSKKVSHDR